MFILSRKSFWSQMSCYINTVKMAIQHSLDSLYERGLQNKNFSRNGKVYVLAKREILKLVLSLKTLYLVHYILRYCNVLTTNRCLNIKCLNFSHNYSVHQPINGMMKPLAENVHQVTCLGSEQMCAMECLFSCCELQLELHICKLQLFVKLTSITLSCQ